MNEWFGITDVEITRTLWAIVQNMKTVGAQCTVTQLLTAIDGGYEMLLENLDTEALRKEGEAFDNKATCK